MPVAPRGARQKNQSSTTQVYLLLHQVHQILLALSFQSQTYFSKVSVTAWAAEHRAKLGSWYGIGDPAEPV